MKRWMLAAAGSATVILILAFFYIRGTPSYSLYMLQRAVENHDADEALKYIDVDSIVDRLAATLVGKDTSADKHSSKVSNLKTTVSDNLPRIKDSLRASLRQAIVSSGPPEIKTPDDAERIGKRGSYRTGNKSDRPHGDQSVQGAQQGDPGSAGHGFSVGSIAIGNMDLEKVRKVSLKDLRVVRDGREATVYLINNPHVRAKMVRTETGYWQFVDITFVP